jgi:hypothetical protein
MPVIEESFTVKAPVQKVWDFLMDLEEMGACVPGCEAVNPIDDDTFEVTFKVKLAFVTARPTLRITVYEKSPPYHLKSSAKGKDSDRASTFDLKNSLDLKALSDGETEVGLRSEINIAGKLARFGFSIFREKFKQQNREFTLKLKSRLEDGSTDPH